MSDKNVKNIAHAYSVVTSVPLHRNDPFPQGGGGHMPLVKPNMHLSTNQETGRQSYLISAGGPAVVGPMPTITDSLFSLIIFIYVMITFLYLFYGFCWIEPPKLTEEQKKELAKQVEIFDKNRIQYNAIALAE